MKRASGFTVVGLLLALPLLVACAGPTHAASSDEPDQRHLSLRLYSTDSSTPNLLINLPLRVVTAAVRIASIAQAFGARIEFDGVELGGGHSLRLDKVDWKAVRKALRTVEQGPLLQVENGRERIEIWID